MKRLATLITLLSGCSLIFEAAPPEDTTDQGCCIAAGADGGVALKADDDKPYPLYCQRDSDCEDGKICRRDYRVAGGSTDLTIGACLPDPGASPDAAVPEPAVADAAVPEPDAEPAPIECASVISQTGCEGGEGCYYGYNGDVGYCHEAGTKAQGEFCVDQHDCEAGMVCDDFCWPACDTTADCPGGMECTASPLPGMNRCLM